MSKGLKIAGIFLLLSGLALAAIPPVVYAVNQYKALMNFCYKYHRSYGINLIGKTIDFTIEIMLKNRSEIAVKLRNQFYKISINGKPVSEIRIKEDLLVKPNSEPTFIPLRVSILKKDLAKAGIDNIENLLLDRDKIKIRTQGYVSAFTILENLPIDFTYTLKEMMTPSEGGDEC